MTTSIRDRTTGRFRRVRDFPTCPDCGSTLHERLDGDLVCVMAWCRRKG